MNEQMLRSRLLKHCSRKVIRAVEAGHAELVVALALGCKF